MKKLILIASILFASVAQAQVTAGDLIGLGMPSELASEVAKLNSATGALLPAADDTYDIGSSSLAYKNMYVADTFTFTDDLGGVYGTGTDTRAVLSASNASTANSAYILLEADDYGGAESGAGATLFVGNNAGSIFTITDSHSSNDVGWAVVAGANTACGTTCTSACVFGVNTASATADIVDCTDATADECLCAGAS